MDNKRAKSFSQTTISVALAGVMALGAGMAHADDVADLTLQLEALKMRLEALESQKAAAVKAEKPKITANSATSTDIDGKPAKGDATVLYDNGNSSMRVYGIVEATLSHADNQNGEKSKSATASGFQVAYFSGNRLGFDFQHGIGDILGLTDVKVISRLESEFELPTGAQDTAGNLFNRDAWLGFYSKDLGKLTFGRQNTLTRDFTANWGDPFGSATVSTSEGGYSNVNNFKNLIFYSASPTGTRSNSAIEWKKEFNQHIVAGAEYAFGSSGNGGSADPGAGGSVPGNFANGTAQQVSLAYQRINLGPVQLNTNVSYDRGDKNNKIDQSWLGGGNAVMGPWRINAGYIHYTGQQGAAWGDRTDNAWTTSLQFKPGKWEFDAGYQDAHIHNAGLGANGITLNPFFGNTTGITGVSTGDRKSIYGAVKYNVDKHLDVYVAADQVKVSGSLVVGDAQGNGTKLGAGQAHNSELEMATGIRYKF